MKVFQGLAVLFVLVGMLWAGYNYRLSLLPQVEARILEAKLERGDNQQYHVAYKLEYSFKNQVQVASLNTNFDSRSQELMEKEAAAHPVGSTLPLLLDGQKLHWPVDNLGPALLALLGVLFWAVAQGVLTLTGSKLPVGVIVWRTFGPLGALSCAAGVASGLLQWDRDRRWPVATATIVEAQVAEATSRSFQVRVKCRYLETEKVFYSPWKVSAAAAQSWIGEHPPGSHIQIHYHPEDKTTARWSQASSAYALSVAAILGGLTFLGLGGLLLTFAGKP
jgi:hypothetical protein